MMENATEVNNVRKCIVLPNTNQFVPKIMKKRREHSQIHVKWKRLTVLYRRIKVNKFLIRNS